MIGPILLGELALSSTGAPDAFVVLRDGDNPTRKGIIVVLDDEARASVRAEYEKGGVLLPVDVDHAMADDSTRVEDRFAAGWLQPEVETRDLVARVEWTDKGRQLVESKEWRYTSLWGDLEPLGENRFRLVRLFSVSLVNRPATLNTLPLVANEGQPTEGRNTMDNDKTLSEAIERAATLTTTLSDVASTLEVEAKPETVKGAIRALKLKADKADSLQAQLNELTEKAEADKKAGLIAKLSEDGKLPPSLHDWAKTQSIESLTAFGEHAPILAPANKIESAKTEQSGVVTLSEEDKQVAALVGNSTEFLTKHKASLTAA